VFEPSPQVSVYLWLDRKLAPDRYWARAACGTQLNNEFYDLSNIRTGWSGRASVIASNIIHSHRADSLSDEELVETTLAELAATVPDAARARVLHSVVNRIPMAVPCPAPGTEQKRPDVATAIPGLWLAGDWTRTQLPACMEGAVRSGWLAAEGVWSAIGQPRTLARPLPQPEGIAGMVQRVLTRSRRTARFPARPMTPLGA
jgi:15-cis-phytoene desaturase